MPTELHHLPHAHLPGSAAYDDAVAPWNVSVSPCPVAVVDATSADDVVAAVRYAVGHGLRVAVQATGHGIASDLDGVLMISTRRMTGLTLDAAARTARVEAGVRWGQVLEAGAPHGLTCPAGSAPHVGVVGYATGGGVGPLSHTLGLASDRVRAFEVVTGDGELRRATPIEHPDLYWGLRGGRGLLGVVTALELELVPLGEILGGAVYFDGADATTVLRRWASWSAELPREATTSVALLRLPPLPHVPPPLAGRLTVAVRFAWTGAPDRGVEILAPMRDAAASLVDTVAMMPCAALGTIHSDPVGPMPARDHHALLGDLSDEAVDRLVEMAGPDAECPQVVVELRRLGGAVADPPPYDSAFCHRGATHTLTTIGLGVPPLVAAVDAHAEATLTAMEPWTVPGGLPTFAVRPGPAWLASRYDEPTLRRLAQVSAAYDAAGTLHGVDDLREAALAGHR